MRHIAENIQDIPELTSSLDISLSSYKSTIKIDGKIDDDALIAELHKRLILSSTAKNRLDSLSEQIAINQPIQIEIGVDEVGRGPLYGSVVVSAVILPHTYSGAIDDNILQETSLSKLTDSKKLTEIKREQLFPLIKQQSLTYVTVNIPAGVIDEINILQATLLGMRLSCEYLMTDIARLLTTTKPTSDVSMLDNIQFKLLIDGNKVPSLDWQTLERYGLGETLGDKVVAEAWVKGDARHTAIAAASVLAKVTRDRQMVQDGLVYPDYGLQSHKGYPTKTHIEAIYRLGVLPQHRRSFKPIRNALAQQTKPEV